MPEDLDGTLRTAIERAAADVSPPPFDRLLARRRRRSRLTGGAAVAALAVAVAVIATVPAALRGRDDRSAPPGQAPASAPGATSPSPTGTPSHTPDAPALRVADAFDAAPPYPGHRWTRNGESAPEFVIMSSAMPDHCNWQRATHLALGWPLGSPIKGPNPNAGRDYVRDPHGVLDNARVQRDFSPRAQLPHDARATGFRTGHVELWLAPSDQDRFAYLVNVADHTDAERWPRHEGVPGCY